jgi:hypothetical protein
LFADCQIIEEEEPAPASGGTFASLELAMGSSGLFTDSDLFDLFSKNNESLDSFC